MPEAVSQPSSGAWPAATGRLRVVPNGLGGLAGRGTDLGRLMFVVGAFDGLHRGHRYLLACLRDAAAAQHARPAVITFDHHPDEILVGTAPPVLCDPDERLVRFEQAGVDVVVIQHFDAVVRMTPYDEFVRAIAGQVELAGFLMTPDAAFGHDRGGTPERLAGLGRRLGFEVSVVQPLEVDGRPVRSSEIRSDIAAGQLPAARRLLGRSLAVTGRTAPDPGDRGPWSVEFELPVALPPAGRYRAGAEVAWAPGVARSSNPVPALAELGSDGSLSLELLGRRPAPPGNRVRIRLVGQVS
jgi:hypothetical protein